MRFRFCILSSTVAFILALTGSANGQAPTSPAVARLHYVTIPLEIEVNRPASEVWARVGKYCDIGEWFPVPCRIVSGEDGRIGAVRSVLNEVLVGRTELSYTYADPTQEGRPYNFFHGTLEAKPVSETTSKLVYTLLYDDSMLPDDKARDAHRVGLARVFTLALRNMKILAEGGTLPALPPSRGGPPEVDVK
jgi:hypothetical protein